MAFTVLRVEKLKTMGNVAGSASHTFRERPTRNADSRRLHKNSTHGAASARGVVDAVQARLSTVPTVRKNAVLAVEYLLTAGPEWPGWNGKGEAAFFQRARAWLIERHGAENVVSVSVHRDESTPHMVAYVVPIDDRGKLNSSAWLDGRKRLSDMQTDFAARVADLGLERGIEGSKAEHLPISQYYAGVCAAADSFPAPGSLPPAPAMPEPNLLGFVKAAEVDALAQGYQKREKVLRGMVKESMSKSAKAAAYDSQRRILKAREAGLAAAAAQSVQLRAIPLDVVLEAMGATPDKSDKHNWRTSAGRITVTGERFFNHDAGKGGGGALDLVMHIDGVDFSTAKKTLIAIAGAPAVVSDLAHRAAAEVKDMESTVKPFAAPPAVDQAWLDVLGYLTRKRGIKREVVERLHDEGRIYATTQAGHVNCAFALDDGDGVSLRGVAGTFHGVRGKKSSFTLPGVGREVAIVESPIDALSLRSLGWMGRIVATVGSAKKAVIEKIRALRAEGYIVVAAHDNDKTGHAMAYALGADRRIVPTGKDWNEDVIAGRTLDDGSAPAAPAPRTTAPRRGRDLGLG